MEASRWPGAHPNSVWFIQFRRIYILDANGMELEIQGVCSFDHMEYFTLYQLCQHAFCGERFRSVQVKKNRD